MNLRALYFRYPSHQNKLLYSFKNCNKELYNKIEVQTKQLNKDIKWFIPEGVNHCGAICLCWKIDLNLKITKL